VLSIKEKTRINQPTPKFLFYPSLFYPRQVHKHLKKNSEFCFYPHSTQSSFIYVAILGEAYPPLCARPVKYHILSTLLSFLSAPKAAAPVAIAIFEKPGIWSSIFVSYFRQ